MASASRVQLNVRANSSQSVVNIIYQMLSEAREAVKLISNKSQHCGGEEENLTGKRGWEVVR